VWQKFVSALKAIVPSLIKNFLVKLVMGAVGIGGGIWAWLIGDALEFLWAKEIEPAIEAAAAGADEKKTEDENLKKLADATNKGDLDAMAKAGSDLLNGSSSK
jgi:hypothetical protein